MTKRECKALTTGTELLSTTSPTSLSPSVLLLPNSSAFRRKTVRCRAEVCLTPRKPHIPLRSWPGNFREELKFYGSLRHRQPTWSLSDLVQYPDSVSRVWAAFTVGRGNEVTYGWGSLGHFKVLLLLPLHPSYGIGWTSPSCKSQRQLSQSGRVACRKVLVPLRLHSLKNHFWWQVSVTHDFTDWSLW